MSGERDLLQLLANPTNRTILSVLSLEPQYPRRLAELVGLTEDEASRRLRSFEKLGLAEGSWANIGKNVRLYRLATNKFTVTVDATGLSVAGVEGEKPVARAHVAEMPPSLEHFVGRDEELTTIESLLAARRGVALLGLGGAGKTALAAAYAKRSGRPTVWHTLAPGESATLLLGRLAANVRAVDTSERGQRLVNLREAEDESVLVRALLESLNALGGLLVLDRLETAGEGATEIAADLARGLTDARILLTSRTFPPGLPRDLVASYRVPGLSRMDAERLLAAFGARVGGDALNEIYDRTHGHPLSLVLVSQVADEARDARVERLMQESGIRDFLIEDVLPQLTEVERDVLFALSVVRQPFLPDEAEAISGSKHARHALLRLEGRGLVARAGDTFLLHDLVRAFVAEAAPQKKALHARAAKFLKSTGEPVKVLEAIHHHLEAGAIAEAGAIVREEGRNRSYRFSDLGSSTTYRDVLARLATHDRTDDAARAAAELELAILDTFAGEAESASTHLAAAERLAGHAPDLAAPLLLARARALRYAGRLDEAGKAYQAAVDATKRAKDVSHRIIALVDWAFMEEERDDRVAFKLDMEAAELAKETSDLRSLSLALAGAARIRLRSGDSAYLPMAQEALRLARLTGYLRGEVSVYMTLTTHAMITGATESGLEYSDRYVAIAHQLGDPWLTACALNDKAILLVGAQRFQDALPLADEAVRFARQIHSVFFEFGGHLCAAEALLGLGKPQEAADRLAPALKMRIQAWPAFTGRGWRVMAAAQRALGKSTEAAKADRQAAAWAQKDRPGDVSRDVAHAPGLGRLHEISAVSARAQDAARATQPAPRKPRGRSR